MNGYEIAASIIGLVFGVSLFLFGMGVMGDGLKRVAGNKLESYLYKLTNTPIKGILLGAGVTAIIQSSSATSVMVVGFVNAGMMKVIQGIGIIMGANIGTSITGWILCLNDIGGAGVASILGSTTIAAIFAFIGILLKNTGKKDALKYLGDIMLGFAVLMEGMTIMKNAMSDVGKLESVQTAISKLSNPILGILIGIVFTAILQSASASIGVLQSMTGASAAATLVLPFSVALPMIMGIGIGAAAPVLISGMQSTSKNGKRTAIVYLINDLFGCIIWATIFYVARGIYMAMNGHDLAIMSMEMNSVKIALLNTVYRILTILVLAPFINQINKLVFWLVKEEAQEVEEQPDFDLLEERFLAYPDLALAQSHTVMNSMAKKARKNVIRAIELMDDYTEEKFAKIQEKENLLDQYEDKLGTYLMQVTGRDLGVAQTKETSKLLHTISDFERIGDHASGISKVAKELADKGIEFSPQAMYELSVLEDAVREVVDLTVKAFINDDATLAHQIEPLRQVIRVLCGDLKKSHIKRLAKGKCDMEHGFAFNDMLTNLDRIGAHCSNVAVALIELEEEEIESHGYLKEIRENKDENFVSSFDSYSAKYMLKNVKKKKKKDKDKDRIVKDKFDSDKDDD